jgi:transcriptional regulator with XRE-family HTH domain
VKNRLKELRKDKGLSLNALRLILNEEYDIKVSNSQLMYYENGVRSPRSAKIWEALADYFGVNVAYLMGHVDFAQSSKDLIKETRDLMEELELNGENSPKRFIKNIENLKKRIDLLIELIELKPKNLNIVVEMLTTMKEDIQDLEISFNIALISQKNKFRDIMQKEKVSDLQNEIKKINDNND